MTTLQILDDQSAELICGGLYVSLDLNATLTKVVTKYTQSNSLENNVGAKILTKGAVLAASITNTQLNSIGAPLVA